jgi:hypothetical protein
VLSPYYRAGYGHVGCIRYGGPGNLGNMGKVRRFGKSDVTGPGEAVLTSMAGWRFIENYDDEALG